MVPACVMVCAAPSLHQLCTAAPLHACTIIVCIAHSLHHDTAGIPGYVILLSSFLSLQEDAENQESKSKSKSKPITSASQLIYQ